MENLNVVELKQDELQEVDGGILFMMAYNYAAIAVVGLAVYGAVKSGWDACECD